MSAASLKIEKLKSSVSQKSMNENLQEIPSDVKERISKLSKSVPSLEGITKNLIKTLQTHPDKTKELEEK